METITIEKIIGLFPTKTEDMPKISTPGNRPTYTSLRLFQDKLDVNAMSIPFPKTRLGHLGLVLPTATYKAVNNNDEWEDPEEPSDNPSQPKLTTKNSQTDPFVAQEAIRRWQRTTNRYATFILTQEALKNQILKSVDEQYINALEHEITKYSQVTPRALLEHLWKHYGKITEADLRANEARMKTTWHPPSPIEDLFKQLRDGQKFAKKGGEDITDSMLVRMAYDQIYATGLFNQACEDWCDKEPTDKTLENLQNFFTNKITNHINNATANDAKYSLAQVQEMLDSNIAAYVAAVTNQAPTTPTTDEAAPPPEAANAISTTDIENIVKRMMPNKENAKNPNNNNKKNNNTIRVAQGFNTNGDPISYCWSHGVTKNLGHTSTTCRRKKEGHQDAATLNNRMNGSNEVCEKRE